MQPRVSPRRTVVAALAAVAIAAGVGVLAAIRGDAGSPPSRSGAHFEIPRAIVDPDDIVSAGPPPDGIPPIDDPVFQSVEEVEWLTDDEPVIALVINGDARAYPLQILIWHEIVNDTVGGVPVSVTFCPLCYTAYVFDRPEVDGKVTTFGTSGKLYYSNLVMYDRATNSYWPQVFGQAVMGPLRGTTLERRPAQIVSWMDFREQFVGGRVLSRATGHEREYGQNPYVGYDDIDRPAFLVDNGVNGRLTAKERVLGVESAGEIMAFPYTLLQRAGRGKWAAVNRRVGGNPVVVFWNQGAVSALDHRIISSSSKIGAAAAFHPVVGGRRLMFVATEKGLFDKQTGTRWTLFGTAVRGPLRGEELRAADAHDSYWFDWSAFHPDTGVWRP